jgi:hypothetical protein
MLRKDWKRYFFVVIGLVYLNHTRYPNTRKFGNFGCGCDSHLALIIQLGSGTDTHSIPKKLGELWVPNGCHFWLDFGQFIGACMEHVGVQVEIRSMCHPLSPLFSKTFWHICQLNNICSNNQVIITVSSW